MKNLSKKSFFVTLVTLCYFVCSCTEEYNEKFIEDGIVSGSEGGLIAIAKPEIVDFTPKLVPVEHSIKLWGKYLSKVYEAYIGEEQSNIIGFNKGELDTLIIMPYRGTTDGVIRIKNSAGETETEDTLVIEYPIPVISEFPNFVDTGSKMIIKGRYLNFVTKVSFGDLVSEEFSVLPETDNCELEVLVPQNLKKGDYKIFIGYNNEKNQGVIESTNYFTPNVIIKMPEFAKDCPKSGSEGGVVTLTGTDMNNITKIELTYTDGKENLICNIKSSTYSDLQFELPDDNVDDGKPFEYAIVKATYDESKPTGYVLLPDFRVAGKVDNFITFNDKMLYGKLYNSIEPYNVPLFYNALKGETYTIQNIREQNLLLNPDDRNMALNLNDNFHFYVNNNSAGTTISILNPRDKNQSTYYYYRFNDLNLTGDDLRLVCWLDENGKNTGVAKGFFAKRDVRFLKITDPIILGAFGNRLVEDYEKMSIDDLISEMSQPTSNNISIKNTDKAPMLIFFAEYLNGTTDVENIENVGFIYIRNYDLDVDGKTSACTLKFDSYYSTFKKE